MPTKGGIWIDHRQAIVVLVTDTGKTIKKIASGIQSPLHSKIQHKYTKNDFFADDRRQNKVTTHLDAFYKKVIDYVISADAMLVIGPGEAKGEFVKCLKSKKRSGWIVELETTDKMTDRQLAVKIDQHFAKNTANKSATPKRTKTRSANSTSLKHTKKSVGKP